LIKELEAPGISWKRQTINTFLGRLLEKGLVIHDSEKRKYIFAYTKEEYVSHRVKEFLDEEYSGSIKK